MKDRCLRYKNILQQKKDFSKIWEITLFQEFNQGSPVCMWQRCHKYLIII